MPIIPKRQESVRPAASQVAQAKLSAPPEAAFGGQIGQAVANLGQNVNNFSQILTNIKLQEDENKIKKYENNLMVSAADLRTKLKNGEIIPPTLEELYKYYSDEAANSGKAALGKDLYALWASGRGADFNRARQFDLAHDYAALKYDKNIVDIKELGRQAAVEASTVQNPLEAKKIRDAYINEVNNGRFVPKDKQVIINEFNHNTSLADVKRDMRAAPMMSVGKLQNDAKSYEYLSELERQQWIEAGNSLAASRKGTSADEKIEPFKNVFHRLFQTNPEVAARYYRDLINAPADAPVNLDNEILQIIGVNKDELGAKLKSLSAKDKESYFGFMKGILTDKQRNYAEQNAQFFENSQVKFNSFEIDKQGKITNKELNNVESLVKSISEIEGAIHNGSLANYTDKSQNMLFTLRSSLGQLVADEGFKLRDKNIFSRTASQETKVALLDDLNIINKHFGREIFTKEQVGAITESVYCELMASNIDTASSKTDVVKAALAVERQVLRDKFGTVFGLGDKEFDAILYRGTMLPYIMKRGKELITSALPMGQGVNAVADIVYSDNYRDKQITKELTSAAFKQAKSGVKRGLNKAKEVSAPIADYIDDLIGSNELWDKDSQ